LHYQFPGIFGWEENVVHMNDNPRLEIWQYFQEFVLYVSRDSYNVARVQKQDVVFLEFLKHCDGDILHFAYHESGEAWETFPQIPIREWFERNELPGRAPAFLIIN